MPAPPATLANWLMPIRIGLRFRTCPQNTHRIATLNQLISYSMKTDLLFLSDFGVAKVLADTRRKKKLYEKH
jgi:hypothetical protein